MKCYDELTKTESNRCPEPRPVQKKKCSPAPDCRPRYSKSHSYTCQDVQRSRRIRQDGEYTLNIKGKPVSIYCHNMTSNTPTEYLTLKSGKYRYLYCVVSIAPSFVLFVLNDGIFLFGSNHRCNRGSPTTLHAGHLFALYQPCSHQTPFSQGCCEVF